MQAKPTSFMYRKSASFTSLLFDKIASAISFEKNVINEPKAINTYAIIIISQNPLFCKFFSNKSCFISVAEGGVKILYFSPPSWRIGKNSSEWTNQTPSKNQSCLG
jgi:hypothetical protein